jgi:hypothetical protein
MERRYKFEIVRYPNRFYVTSLRERNQVEDPKQSECIYYFCHSDRRPSIVRLEGCRQQNRIINCLYNGYGTSPFTRCDIMVPENDYRYRKLGRQDIIEYSEYQRLFGVHFPPLVKDAEAYIWTHERILTESQIWFIIRNCDPLVKIKTTAKHLLDKVPRTLTFTTAKTIVKVAPNWQDKCLPENLHSLLYVLKGLRLCLYLECATYSDLIDVTVELNSFIYEDDAGNLPALGIKVLDICKSFLLRFKK